MAHILGPPRPCSVALVLGLAAFVGFAPVACPAEDPVSAALEAARDAFRPLRAEDLERERKDLVLAVERLDKWLKRAGTVGEGWRRYLRWDEWAAQLDGRREPDYQTLNRLYARLASGRYGLERKRFADVRGALHRYLITASAIANPKLRAQYDQVLSGLEEVWNRYRVSPSAEDRRSMNVILEWLESAGQGERLLEAIRRHCAQPNLYVEISEPVVVAGIERDVDETAPVRDVILGANICGTGRTVGRLVAELVPARGRAEVRLTLRGRNHARTVGYKGPARVYSRGLTELVGTKTLIIRPEGVTAGPSRCRATTDTKIIGVGTRRGSRLVRRIACRRARKTRCQAEWIAARHAERDLRRRLDREAAEPIERANRQLRQRLWRPLDERNLRPRSLELESTATALRLRLLAARSFELAAPGPPPPTPEGVDLSVRIHESSISNFLAAAIGGMRLEDEQLRGELKDLLGRLPEGLEATEQGQPWAITFDAREPVTVWFDENQFRVRVRGAAFTSGRRRYPGMHVTATYRIEQSDRGWVAVRQGDLEITPPRFEGGVRRPLSPRESALKTLLLRRFAKIFRERIPSEPIELPGRWEKAGPLELVHWQTQGGWMTLAWRRRPATGDSSQKVASR
ncbi:MAG TPA: hypothetical protein EYP56_10555 [Planctomycetaceae bacterium]|nr:hypothetical protein [Planctomycetaceae bacterium]